MANFSANPSGVRSLIPDHCTSHCRQWRSINHHGSFPRYVNKSFYTHKFLSISPDNETASTGRVLMNRILFFNEINQFITATNVPFCFVV